MSPSDYLALLKSRLTRYFDLQEKAQVLGWEIDLFGTLRLESRRYILDPRWVMDRYHCFEYCFVKAFSRAVTLEDIQQFQSFLRQAEGEFVHPDFEHMRSYLTGVIVAPKVASEELKRSVRQMRWRRSYALGLKGWSEIRLVLVDLDGGDVTGNRAAREVLSYFRPRAFS